MPPCLLLPTARKIGPQLPAPRLIIDLLPLLGFTPGCGIAPAVWNIYLGLSKNSRILVPKMNQLSQVWPGLIIVERDHGKRDAASKDCARVILLPHGELAHDP
jgi:hypothetical protein